MYTHSKGLEGTLPALTHDQELGLFPTARLESLKIHGTMGRIISIDFASKGKMSSGLVLLESLLTNTRSKTQEEKPVSQ